MEEQTNKQRIVRQSEDDPIKRISARYERNALWVVMGLTLAILLGMNIVRDTRGATPLVITAVYFLIVVKGHAAWWRHSTRKDPTRQAMILLTEGVVRLVISAAVFTVLAFWAKGEGLVLVSTAIFCGYFVALLIFDVIFITRNEIYKKE